MARRYCFKTCVQRSFLLFSFVILAMLALTGSSCEPDQGPAAPPSPVLQKPAVQPPEPGFDLQTVFDSICRGDFQQAEQALSRVPQGPGATQIAGLLDQQKHIEKVRRQKREAAWQEQMDELAKIQEGVSAKDAPDVNDIDDTMIAVLRVREYASEEKKDDVLEHPFVKDVLAKMQANAEQNLQQGKWIDAYAHCYYWLVSLYEADKTYEDKAEELTELSSIELSLKDSSCDEKALDRYDGIKKVMYLRAIELLNNNYVHQIDCAEMVADSLTRCRLLGKVLERTNEELPWSVSKEAVQKWNEGLRVLQSQVDLLDQNAQPIKTDMLARTLDDVIALNSVTLELPDEILIAHFAEASLGALDPFTSLVWPWSVKDFEKSMTQQFTGIGVEISKATGVLRVVSLLPDTPAYKSGLDAEDEILAVNGESTKEMTIYCAVSKITGPKGTDVTLTIRRPSTGETRDVTIKRGKIVVQPLRGWQRDGNGDWDYLIDPQNKIGYVRLTAFTETSGPDLDEVLRKLEKDGLKGLILDLRFNSGGYLQSAAEVVDLFIKEGVIVKSNPRHGFATYEIAHRSGTHSDFPLVVLINGSSASASEIVAGALQDAQHRRATLVGQRSYGKGSVQVVTPFTGGGSQLKYTVSYYHLPSDQRVENRYQKQKEGLTDWGIAPDVEVKMLSNEMKEMIDIQRDNDVLARTDHEANGGQSRRHNLQETLQVDPQLSTALLVLQSKLIVAGHELVPGPVLAENSSVEPAQEQMQ